MRENTAWIQPLQDLVEKYTLQEPPQQQEPVCGCLYIYSLDYPSYLGNGKHQLPTAVKKPICVHLISDLLCLGRIATSRKGGTSLYWFLIDWDRKQTYRILPVGLVSRDGLHTARSEMFATCQPGGREIHIVSLFDEIRIRKHWTITSVNWVQKRTCRKNNPGMDVSIFKVKKNKYTFLPFWSIEYTHTFDELVKH